jgi:hypothetical protein
MQTLNIAELRKEREALTKRVAALDKLLDAVDSFDGTDGRKKPGRPKGKSHMSAKGRAAIARAQKKRWAKVKAAKKAAAKSGQ